MGRRTRGGRTSSKTVMSSALPIQNQLMQVTETTNIMKKKMHHTARAPK